MVDLDALKALLEEATQGEISALPRGGGRPSPIVVHKDSGVTLAKFDWERDAIWHAALHNSAPAMIAELEAAREAVKVAKAALEQTHSGAWDGYLGKGLSLAYARAVSAARKRAFSAIAAYEEKHGTR